MNPAFYTYVRSLAGRDVTVIGAGVSNSPLIRMLCSAGARVIRTRPQSGPAPEEWDNLRVELRLGENYLDRIGGDVGYALRACVGPSGAGLGPRWRQP